LFRQWRVALCWICFAAGLAVQLFGPRLEISKGVFIVPAALTVQQGKEFNPEKLIQRERQVQLASAILTLGGAIGLALLYRGVLRKRTPEKEALNRETGLAKL
jgi:hypothetical protein